MLVLCGVAAVFVASPIPTRLAPPAPPGRPEPPRAGEVTCTNSDGSACPESYFTGPLGRNNLVPSRPGAFLIEYYNRVGAEWPEVQQAILQRQRDIGRTFDGVQISYGGDGKWDGVYGMYSPNDYAPRREQWVIDNGSFVAVTWTPNYTIGQINDGEADAILAKAASYWKSYAPHPIMLRPFAEFNLPSTSSAVPSADNGYVNYCGAPFVTAWQRVVRIFQDNGADNVGFWFTPDEGADRPCVDQSYPGDSYVDWVGSDFYNRCFAGQDVCYSTPLRPGPATFGDLFGYTGTCADGSPCKANLHDLLGPRKPFVVGEVGTVYDPGQPGFKGDFYRSIPAEGRRLQYLRGVSLFDADVTVLEGPNTNWHVDHPRGDPGPYDGFKAMANDPWMQARRAGQ